MKQAFKAALASGIVLLAPIVGGGLPHASAHDVVMRSTPGDGATVAEFPKTLELEFSGIPKESFNTIALSNQDTGEVLLSTAPELENQLVRVQIPADVPAKPGNYKIGFQITSSDGHATRGMTTFKVAGDASSNAQSTAVIDDQTQREAAGSNNSYIYLAVGTIAFIALAVGVILALSHRKKKL
ncbi:copper resistance protein CopC [Corynebacterium sp. H128]|uniref:copper resistance CopC family protein n=1 Tax=unclassified Corynebacterium TaxID=2624378 RepID=UPI0030AA9EAA